MFDNIPLCVCVCVCGVRGREGGRGGRESARIIEREERDREKRE